MPAHRTRCSWCSMPIRARTRSPRRSSSPQAVGVTGIILFAVYAFIDAGFQAMRAFSSPAAGPVFGHLLLALIALAAGVVALVWPGPTALVLVVGIWAFAGRDHGDLGRVRQRSPASRCAAPARPCTRSCPRPPEPGQAYSRTLECHPRAAPGYLTRGRDTAAFRIVLSGRLGRPPRNGFRPASATWRWLCAGVGTGPDDALDERSRVSASRYASVHMAADCPAGQRSSWMRTRLPAGSRKAQSRTPYGCSVGSWTTSASPACSRSKVPSRSVVARRIQP